MTASTGPIPPPTADVFELVLARPVVLHDRQHPHLVHLAWVAPEQGDRLVRVSIDSRPFAMTLRAEQRELWLVLDRSRPHRIDLLAISTRDAENLWSSRDIPGPYDTTTDRNALTLCLPRDESWPLDARATVTLDDTDLSAHALWPSTVHRGGFGGLFGLGPFGLDPATAPGLAQPRTALGFGPLGTGGSPLCIDLDHLDPGDRRITLALADPGGRPISEPSTPRCFCISDPPLAAETFTIDAGFIARWHVPGDPA